LRGAVIGKVERPGNHRAFSFLSAPFNAAVSSELTRRRPTTWCVRAGKLGDIVAITARAPPFASNCHLFFRAFLD
jgi:hypothetical protein